MICEYNPVSHPKVQKSSGLLISEREENFFLTKKYSLKQWELPYLQAFFSCRRAVDCIIFLKNFWIMLKFCGKRILNSAKFSKPKRNLKEPNKSRKELLLKNLEPEQLFESGCLRLAVHWQYDAPSTQQVQFGHQNRLQSSIDNFNNCFFFQNGDGPAKSWLPFGLPSKRHTVWRLL